MKKNNIPLDKVCLLDPRAESELSPEDGDGRFSWFLFGVSCPFYHLACKPRGTGMAAPDTHFK